ncbi:MAG: UDP-N-acetylmuramoyl-tripeptide--D-alanyl-D-alanine ligase [Deltaproteobacteria bacterium]|nr:UDP-N-acetylmuramoyl-tripeptide--D-alanyl-D-alanine ligase [Deltaproteobacteria bacterium]
MIELTMADISAMTGGVLLQGQPDCPIRGVSTDSRTLKPGNLFVPIVGESFNGHDFLLAAWKAEAGGFLTAREKAEQALSIAGDVAVVAVEDTLKAYGDIAATWRRQWPGIVVAVTGSVGKTTTKEMIAAVLSRHKRILKSHGNFNNLVGLPKTLLELEPADEVAVVELGASRRGEISRLAEIAYPDVSVVTAIGPAHLEGFGTVNAIAEEKTAIFRNIRAGGVAVINADEPLIRTASTGTAGRSISFGISERADFQAVHLWRNKAGLLEFVLSAEGEEMKVALPVSGSHNVMNALAAAAACRALGLSLKDIAAGLSRLNIPSGRMKIVRLANGASLLDDSYNANPLSVTAALDSLQDLSGEGRACVILGDMLELGDRAEELHEEMGRLVAERGVERLYATGDHAEEVRRGALTGGMGEDAVQIFHSWADIADDAEAWIGEGDWILVKGSRGMKMERYAAALAERFGLEQKNKGLAGTQT